MLIIWVGLGIITWNMISIQFLYAFRTDHVVHLRNHTPSGVTLVKYFYDLLKACIITK